MFSFYHLNYAYRLIKQTSLKQKYNILRLEGKLCFNFFTKFLFLKKPVQLAGVARSIKTFFLEPDVSPVFSWAIFSFSKSQK